MGARLRAEAAWGVPLGAPVVDAAGEVLGTLRDADPWVLSVDRGRPAPAEYAVATAEVDRYDGRALVLKRTKAQLVGDGA